MLLSRLYSFNIKSWPDVLDIKKTKCVIQKPVLVEKDFLHQENYVIQKPVLGEKDFLHSVATSVYSQLFTVLEESGFSHQVNIFCVKYMKTQQTKGSQTFLLSKTGETSIMWAIIVCGFLTLILYWIRLRRHSKNLPPGLFK